MLVDDGKEKGRDASSEKALRNTFKRQPRAKAGGSNEKQVEGSESLAGRKRSGDEATEVEEKGASGEKDVVAAKKLKFAGLADQPCGDQ
jgi:hypothetical protein